MGRANAITTQQQKELAKMHYMQSPDMTMAELGAAVGVTAHTASRWVKDGGWEADRRASAVSRDAVLRLSYELGEAKYSQLKAKVAAGKDIDNGDIDSMAKMATVIEKLEKGVTVRGHMLSLKTFHIWLAARDKGLARQVQPHINEFFIEEKKRLPN